MSDMPDFSKYSMSELDEAYRSVEKIKFPDNYKAIVAEIAKREKHCAALYMAALRALKDENLEQNAKELFKKIVNEYPGTQEADHASKHLAGYKAKESELATTTEQDKDKPLPKLKLEFSGSVQEYFRIWIVNLCLTLLTFGIFSAWAKVRKKRYLYSNLTLDGTPFQYLGLPIPILRGRVIAALIFLLYYLSSNLFISMLPYIFVVGLILAPWVFVQSVSFNLRYTAFRNITFRFNSSYAEAFKVLSAWGIIPAFVIGMIFDFWGQWWLAAILMIPFSFLFPYWLKEIKKIIVTKASYGGKYGEFGATGGEFFKTYFLAGLIMFFFGTIAAIMLAGAGFVFTDHLEFVAIIFTIISYVGYIVAFAYIQSTITNTVWNQMKLGPLRFQCTLNGLEMAKLYITNALGIAVSAGFLIPWAVIRTIQYRIDNTQVLTASQLTAFRGNPKKDVNAVGAELTDFFDMDLSV